MDSDEILELVKEGIQQLVADGDLDMDEAVDL